MHEDGGEEEPLLSHNTQHLDPSATDSSNLRPSSSRDGTQSDYDDDLPTELQDLKSNAVLLAQGHKSAMQRSFSPFAALGFGFSITNSWVGYLSCFGQNLAYAGPNSVVFGLLVAAVLQWTITLGLSEIASCFPSSGGQYHFVFILAPKKHRKFAAFLVGWMNILGWSIALCSGVSVVVASISGLIAFWNDAYEATQWESFLIYLAVTVLSVAPLFLSPHLIPKIIQTSLVFSVTGLVLVFSLVLALRKQIATALICDIFISWQQWLEFRARMDAGYHQFDVPFQCN